MRNITTRKGAANITQILHMKALIVDWPNSHISCVKLRENCEKLREITRNCDKLRENARKLQKNCEKIARNYKKLR